MISPTLILVILTIAVSFYAWEKKDMYYKWMMNPYKVKREKHYYRFITSGFIHGDWMHLAFNMIALYSFGVHLEAELYTFMGNYYQFYFFGIYFLALIVSDIPTYIKNKNSSSYNSLGASGAVSAIIFACVILDPLSELSIYFVFNLPAFIFGVLYLVYSYYAGKKTVGGINHDAHLYGAVFGVVAIICIHPACLPAFFDQISTWRPFYN